MDVDTAHGRSFGHGLVVPLTKACTRRQASADAVGELRVLAVEEAVRRAGIDGGSCLTLALRQAASNASRSACECPRRATEERETAPLYLGTASMGLGLSGHRLRPEAARRRSRSRPCSRARSRPADTTARRRSRSRPKERAHLPPSLLLRWAAAAAMSACSCLGLSGRRWQELEAVATVVAGRRAREEIVGHRVDPTSAKRPRAPCS